MKDRLILTLSILLILTAPGLFARNGMQKEEKVLLLPGPVCQRDPDPAGEEPEYSASFPDTRETAGEEDE